MGKFDQYFQKAEQLSEQGQNDLESILQTFFRKLDGDPALTPEQEAELTDRLADPDPDYREMTVTEAMFGTPKA